jgi:hypothetical protein
MSSSPFFNQARVFQNSKECMNIWSQLSRLSSFCRSSVSMAKKELCVSTRRVFGPATLSHAQREAFLLHWTLHPKDEQNPIRQMNIDTVTLDLWLQALRMRREQQVGVLLSQPHGMWNRKSVWDIRPVDKLCARDVQAFGTVLGELNVFVLFRAFRNKCIIDFITLRNNITYTIVVIITNLESTPTSVIFSYRLVFSPSCFFQRCVYIQYIQHITAPAYNVT